MVNQIIDGQQILLKRKGTKRRNYMIKSGVSKYLLSKIKTTSIFNRETVSFQGNKKLPFYRWFPYKEGFSFQMVSKILNTSRLEFGEVFDPFAGSGTTLFAAREVGFNSFGIEIMPVGMAVYKARLAVESLSKDIIREEIKKIRTVDFSKAPVDEDCIYKHLKITERAFPEANERCLNAFRTYVAKDIKDSKLKVIFNFVGMCILEKISYTSKDGQFLRWDAIVGKGSGKYHKPKVYSFDEALNEFLELVLNDLNTLSTKDVNKDVEMELKHGNVFEVLPEIKSNRFNLIISSPPYCNRYDYTRTYALELAYLGIDETAIRALRHKMLSSTVESKGKEESLKGFYKERYGGEELSKIESTFTDNVILSDILKKLELLLNNKELNNPGIYKMVLNYFYEHAFIIYEMHRILKRGGHVYYVNDNVRYAGIDIPVDLILSEFAMKLGFDVEDIFVIPQKKGNSSQQMAKHGKTELRKCVYNWVKR